MLLFVTCAALMFFAADWLLAGQVRRYVRGSVSPVMSAIHVTTARIFRTEFWMSRAALEQEVTSLKIEIARSATLEAMLDGVKKENNELRALARMASSTSGITLPLTSSYTSSPYGTFTLGGGWDRGVEKDSIVLAGDGYVLGYIADVTQHESIVRAVFAPGNSIDAHVDSVGLTLFGRGGGNAYAEVPREASLVEGSALRAPAFGSRPVGIIGRIDAASSSAFMTVLASFPYNINDIRFVVVVPQK